MSYAVPAAFGVYNLAFGDSTFNGFIKLGYANLDTSVNDNRVNSNEVKSSQLAAGGGVEYQLSTHFKLRAAYDYYDKDAQFFGIGISYH